MGDTIVNFLDYSDPVTSIMMLETITGCQLSLEQRTFTEGLITEMGEGVNIYDFIDRAKADPSLGSFIQKLREEYDYF